MRPSPPGAAARSPPPPGGRRRPPAGVRSAPRHARRPRPAESLRGEVVALPESLAGPRQARTRMTLGVVAQPQLYRVDAQFVRQLVECRLNREVALGRTGAAHPARVRNVEPYLPVVC